MTLLRRRKFVVAMVITLTLLGCLLLWQSIKDKGRTQGVETFENRRKRVPLFQRILSDKEMPPMSPFEPEVQEDFPTVEAEQHRIPHIIHFIFITDLEGKDGIPATYKANVESFVHFNPKWKYYFWNELLGRLLIARKYPELLSTWNE